VAQTTKPEVPGSSPGSGKGFCDEQLHLLTSHSGLCKYYYQYNLYMYDHQQQHIKRGLNLTKFFLRHFLPPGSSLSAICIIFGRPHRLMYLNIPKLNNLFMNFEF
jgi:hypothetical protein